MTELRGSPLAASPVAIRAIAVSVYAGALATYIDVFGLPKQTVAAVAWIWLAIIAWNVRKPWRFHLAFLRDWWPPLALLTIYLYSRGISDDLGFVAVHVSEPIAADRWLFGGALPTESLQADLCGVPCERTMPPRWYDTVLTTVYYSHFFAALGVGGWLWVRDRPEWIRYMRRYLALTALALAGYIVYPMAPPWMASRDGYLTEDISRITARGWFDLNAGSTVHQDFSAVGNQVAAMPSLHAGLAILVAWYGITRLDSSWKWLLLSYPAAMSFMLVYYAEHYVVDIIAGAVCVVAVMAGSAWWEGRGERRATRPHRHASETAPLDAQRRLGEPAVMTRAGRRLRQR